MNGWVPSKLCDEYVVVDGGVGAVRSLLGSSRTTLNSWWLRG
jgi:hypothetical protein